MTSTAVLPAEIARRARRRPSRPGSARWPRARQRLEPLGPRPATSSAAPRRSQHPHHRRARSQAVADHAQQDQGVEAGLELVDAVHVLVTGHLVWRWDGRGTVDLRRLCGESLGRDGSASSATAP